MLHEFVDMYRDELIGRCRAKVATRIIPPPTEEEIDHGIPVFLDQLVRALQLGNASTPEIRRTALLHGHELLLQGFTVSQVVHDYGDVCQAITELSVEMEAPISTDDFRTLNACLDDAIAVAVTEFARRRDKSVSDDAAARETEAVTAAELRLQSGIDDAAIRGSERLAFVTHELRNLLNTARLAFNVIKTGHVGVGGSTGAVLDRSLAGANDLISRTLAEIKISKDIQNAETFLAAEFFQELVPSAFLAATAARVTLTVSSVEPDVAITADRQILTAIVTNLLQNAYKFTRPGTAVTLRVRSHEERVLIEVQDECGGLPPGDPDELFRPFEQRGSNRTGLGLGLAFSRWGAETNHGKTYARDLPGEGCIFTIDLPRAQVRSSV